MVTRAIDSIERPWGRYYVVYETPGMWVKTIVLNPWSQLSLQVHEHREERWHVPEAGLTAIIGPFTLDLVPRVVYSVPYRMPHRLINHTRYERSLVEVALGQPLEHDIVRLEDDYGRTE